jgi:hypothetical protein
MGPTQSAKVTPFTFSRRTVQSMDHMLENPPPGLVVLIKVRFVTVTDFQDGATG